MDKEKIKLRIYGITYSQVQNGVYALVLAEENGPGRIPVVIGTAEAQSIAVKLEGITPQRPLTHDLFVSFQHSFGVKLDEVFIYKFKDGVFYSELKFSSDDREITIDGRTSDAIAIAIRTKSPIYTTPEVLSAAGFVVETKDDAEKETEDPAEKDKEVRLEQYTVEELEKMMLRCAEKEEYERAAEIKAVIAAKLGDDGAQN